MAFKGVDHIHCGNGLPFGVFGVSHSITDNVFQEDFEDSAGLFVNKPGNTLDTTAASQTSDCWLGDSLDVVSQNLSMALGAPFPSPLPPLPRPDMICFSFECYGCNCCRP